MLLLIACLIVLRNDTRALIEREQAKSSYKTIAVNSFSGVDLSPNWNVKIQKGKDYKVLVEANDSLKPHITNIDGILYCKAEAATGKSNIGHINIKIFTPTIKTIHVRGTKVLLDNFQSDSLRVLLEDGAVLTGTNNQIEYLSVKTSGETSYRFIESATPYVE